MKVLHIFGGMRTFKIANWQTKRGIDVHNLVMEDPKSYEFYYKKTRMKIHKKKGLTKSFEKIKNKNIIFRSHLLIYPMYINFIGKIIKKIQPDMIHAYRHTGAFLTIIAKKIFRLKSKMIFDYQDPWSGEEKTSFFGKIMKKIFYRFERFIVRNSDFIITQGQEQKNMLIKRYGIEKNINYTLNTVDEKIFKVFKKERNDVRKKHEIGNSVAILYLGSIVKYYGVHLIPEAAKYIVKKFPNTKFVMMGVIRDVEYWNSIKKKISYYGLEDNFIEIYPESKEEIPKLIASCDIGLITHMKGSYICEVAIPTKLFEYMASGLAVVTSDLKHITQFLDNCGSSFKANNAKSLGKTLENLLKNKKIIIKMGFNSRRLVEKKFNWDNDMKKLLKIYDSLLK